MFSKAMLTGSRGARPRVLDPESPGSWNSQKQMGVGGEHFSPTPTSLNSLAFLSVPLSHPTIASFLLVGENKQQKVKTLLLASVNKK